MALIDQIGLDKAPTEGVDIAGNLSKGLQTGMQLATAKDQIEANKLKLEEDRYKVDQMKFQAFDSMMKNLNRMNPTVAKQMSKNFKNRFQQYGFDPTIVDVTLADPQFGRAYQNMAELYSGKLLSDKQSLAQAVQSFNDAGMFTEGIAAMKDATDNERSNKQLAQQNTQFYAGLKNAKDIAAMGIDKAQAVADKDIAKEKRKEAKQINEDLFKVDETMANLSKAKTQLEKYTDSTWMGTGPIATGFGSKKFVDQKTEALNTAFNTISLKALTEMFSGMSKAVDTEAERRAFQSTQPDTLLDDKTNMDLIDERIAAAQRMRTKLLNAQSQYQTGAPAESQAVIDFKKYLETTKASPEAKQKALDAFIKKNGG